MKSFSDTYLILVSLNFLSDILFKLYIMRIFHMFDKYGVTQRFIQKNVRTEKYYTNCNFIFLFLDFICHN
jgi:hypothetical protein